MSLIDSSTLEAVKDAYQRSLVGIDPDTASLRQVFSDHPLAGPLALALIDGIVEPVGSRAGDIIQAAHQALGGSAASPQIEKPSDEPRSIFKESESDDEKPAFMTCAEAYFEELQMGNTIKMFRRAREFLDARPVTEDPRFRRILHDIFYGLIKVDQADPFTVSSECTDAIAILCEHIDALSASAINTWVFSILIPANRTDDAIQALSLVVRHADQLSETPLEVGPESLPLRFEAWRETSPDTKSVFIEDVNSLSNTGIVFLQNGAPNKARAVIAAVQSSGLATLVTEADYWLAQISKSCGNEAAWEYWLKRCSAAAKLVGDSNYLAKAQGLLNNTYEEPAIELPGYPIHPDDTVTRAGGDALDRIPTLEEAKTFLINLYPQIDSLTLTDTTIPDLSPTRVSDWANVLFRTGSEKVEDWAQDSPEILEAGFLLAKSSGLSHEALGLWALEFLHHSNAPKNHTLQSLFTLLKDASFFHMKSESGLTSDPTAALSLGVVIMDATSKDSSAAAVSFRSAVSSLVLDALVQAGWTETGNLWATHHPGESDDQTWLTSLAQLVSLGDSEDDLLAALKNLNEERFPRSAFATVRWLLENREWDYIVSHWQEMFTDSQELTLSGVSGYQMLVNRFAVNSNIFEAGNPLQAATLGVAEFSHDRGVPGFRWWLGAREVADLPDHLLDRPDLDIEEIAAAEFGGPSKDGSDRLLRGANRAGWSVGKMHDRQPIGAMFALYTVWQAWSHLDPNPMDGLVNSARTSENLSWPFDFDAMWATLTGAASESQLLAALDFNDERVREAISKSPQLTDAVASKLLKDSTEQEKGYLSAAALLAPNLSPAMTEELSHNIDVDELWRVAAEPSVPLELLRRWAKHDTDSVRRAVARNTSTPDDVLSELALDSSLAVRDAVMNNPSASDETRALVSLQS